MKNKKLIAIIAIICIVILIGVIIICQIARKTDPTDLSNESITTGKQVEIGDPSENMGNSKKEEIMYKSPAGTEGESEGNLPENGELGDTEPDADSNSNSQSNTDPGPYSESYQNIPEIQMNTDSDPDEGMVTFPYTIPNTGLTIRSIASYDGIFLEDGSDSSVSGIYSIVLENTGSMDVEFARITLSCDGMPITFELSDLPSGATVVAQESSQTAYQDGVYRDCTADIAEIDVLEQSTEQISVQENGDGSLTVSNLTDSLIPCVRVFYKFYMTDEDVYVGGITYTAKLTDLEAGGSQTIIPSHYSLGYSKVVMVRTYDSKE